ncbi:retrovirus-related pol polyprotein from transposon TNT 1-94 [Tanacetum coccineum]
MAPDQSSSGPVLHEMMSDQIRSDLSPNRQETSVDNISSDLVSNKQKASYYDTSGPVPPRKNVSHEYQWTKDHPLEQVINNPTNPVQTRQQLATDPEMLYVRLHKESEEPKNEGTGFRKNHLAPSCSFVMQFGFRCIMLHTSPFHFYQMEVKTEFLNGPLKEEVYFAQPEGHAECIDTHNSTSRGIQFLSDKLASKMSKKQYCTAISSTEAQYVALSASCAQVIWMRTQLKVYGFLQRNIVVLRYSQP